MLAKCKRTPRLCCKVRTIGMRSVDDEDYPFSSMAGSPLDTATIPFSPIVLDPKRRSTGSVHLGSGESDHFRPFLGIFGNEPRKFGRRARKGRVGGICKACLHPRIGEAGSDLLVELVDDLGGRASGSAHP